MSIAKLEIRVASLEKKLNDLTNKVDSPALANPNAWIDQIHGTFQNDAAYRQAAKLGREYRKSGSLPTSSRKPAASDHSGHRHF